MRLAAKVVVVALAFSCVGATDEAATKIVQRTRATTSTYAVYSWGGAVNLEGTRENHWSAEFHSGDWHRMEGPDSRVIANCHTHEGFFFDVSTETTTTAPNAYRGSCGVYDPGDVMKVEKLPDLRAGNRRLDVVQVTDPRFIRRYAIDQRGAIVESKWTAANGEAAPCIWTKAISVSDQLPSLEIFTPASLHKSIVSAKFQKRPVLKSSDYLFAPECSG